MNPRRTKASLATIAIVIGILLQAPGAVAKTDTTVDRSFADHGIFKAGGQSITAGYPGGRLLVLRGGRDGVSVERYLSNGRPDPSFGGGDGAVIVRRETRSGKYFWSAGAVAVSDSGDIVLAGYVQQDLGPEAEGGYHLHETFVAKLRPDGTLAWITEERMGEFEGGGNRPLPWGVNSATVEAIAFQGRKILIGGAVGEFTPLDRGVVARLNADGTPDRTFADGDAFVYLPPKPGWDRLSPSARFSEVRALLAAPGGAIYAAGSLRFGLMLVQLTRDGRLDRRFGHDGLVTESTGRHRFMEATGLMRDRRGRLLVSGVGRSLFLALARFHPDGRPDRSFGRAGIVRTRVGEDTFGGGLSIRSDGRILVACVPVSGGSVATGGNRYMLGLLRFLPDGHLDPTFFGDGIYVRPSGGRGFDPSALWTPTIGSNGGILLAGGNAAMRFLSAR